MQYVLKNTIILKNKMVTQSLTNLFDLRRKTEDRLRGKKLKLSMDLTKIDLNTLNHELLIHQIELEMQNEELVRANEMLSKFQRDILICTILLLQGILHLQKRVKLQRRTTVPITCWKENRGNW